MRQKLTTLMDIYRINNVGLARGMGIDPSLVSRWRSGERRPGEEQLKVLAVFLAGTAIRGHDRELLEKTVENTCATREETASALENWLQGDTCSPRSDGLAEDMWAFAEHRLCREKKAAAGPVNLWPHVLKGSPSDHEVFTGDKGRRQAAINFLHALQSARPTVVSLRLWRDTRWIEQDALFAGLWEKGLAQIEELGHNLRVSCDIEEHGVPSPWMETLLCRSTATLYGIRPEQEATLFVAKGVCALMSYHDGAGGQTLYFRNLRDSSLFETMFHQLLPPNPPAILPFPSWEAYRSRRDALEEEPGEIFVRADSLHMWFIPDEMLERLLAVRYPPAEAQSRLARIKRREKCFFSHLNADGWVDALPARLYDAIHLNGSCVFAETPGDSGITLEGAALKAVLENMLRAMERHPSYRVLWENMPPGTPQLTLKPGAEALFGIANPKSGESGFSCTQQRRLESLRRWFEERFDNTAISKMRELISQL